jgi:aldehyde:ferredoxin oxidoreductase
MEARLGGYMGKLLVVDLSSGEIKDEPLNMDYVRRFIGGSGLACRYLYDMVDADTDPLGPENPLFFMAGPLTGTRAPSCSRFVVCARSPLTGLWGEANSGGFFGPEMRFTSYDGIIIKGKAPQPVYLHIADGKATLRDAKYLWGKGTYETQEAIREEVGDAKTRVACIGLAGENLVKYAAIMSDKGRAAARTGMGTVMGSKNLKAVAVRGNEQVPLAEEERFRLIVQEMLSILEDDVLTEAFRVTGTAGTLDYLMLLGSTPNRYFAQGEFPEAEALSGSTMAETILTGYSTCYGCPVACGRNVEVKEGKYKLMETKGPEYETVAALGTLLLIDDLPAVAYLSHLCDACGLDTISTGSTVAFAHYLFERGIIGPTETGGLTLRWGDPGTVADLIGMIARREGFGDTLAEGSRRLGQQYGAEELAAQVNGLELGMHDPRAFSSMALVYATSPLGGSHNQSDMYWVESGRSLDEFGIPMTDRFQVEGKAQIVARHQDWRSFCNALIVCYFSNTPAQSYIDLLAAATSWEVILDDTLLAGERIWNLKRAFNCRLGLTRADDRLPQLLLQPLSEGGTQGHVPDLELMLREYYAARSWDPETGKPSREKLEELELGWVVEDVWGKSS